MKTGSVLAVGSVLAERYRLEELVAHGGMAAVYAAHDEVLHRRVAVKVHRHGSPVDRRRFDRESRVLAGLAHPNVVSVFDAGEQDGEVYVVLEFIDGPTLAERIRAGSLEVDEVRRLGQQLASALAYVHAQRVIHRDVKPSNVMVDRHGQARLGDFGVARVSDATALTATATTVGTAAYMAPEQIEGVEVTPQVDVYALGLVLLECLTGVRAFPGAAPRAALARLARDPDIPGELPAPWPGLLAAMTARQPESRPNADEVQAALVERSGESGTMPVAIATASLPTSPLHPVPGSTGRRSTRWSRAAIWILAAIAVMVGVTVAVFYRDGNPGPTSPSTTAAPPAATATTVVSPSTAPPTTQPAVDCAALEDEKDDLEARKREIGERYRDDRETRDRLRDEVEARKRVVDAQLREHCR